MQHTRSITKRKNRILLDCGTNEVEFLRFFVADKFYGINVSKVRQAIVFEPEKLSVIPQATSAYYGTYLYRGTCIPVITLRGYFGLGQETPHDRTILLVCDFNQCTIGYIVDGIRDILRCSWDNFQPAKQLENSSNLLTGNLLFQDEITPILDVEEMLTKIIPEAGIDRDVPNVKPSQKTEALLGKRVVYCEDSPTVQKVLLRCLQNLGLRDITIFSSGQEGLAYVNAHPEAVDLIISDIEMPRLDGLTLCRELKSRPQSHQIPFLFFSSTITDEMRFKCQSVGGIAAFSKPEISALTTYVDKLLTDS
jgi:two-component system chemotaxis response regulator CheV